MKPRRSFGNSRAAAALLLATIACGGGGSPTSPAGVPAPPPAPTPAPTPAFSLAGQWERFGSSFPELDGMIVEVDAGEARGVIVSTPGNRYQFQAGDLKWANLTRAGNDEYRFDDLVRQSGSGSQSYIAGVLKVQAQGQVDATFPSSGTVQHWRRR